jgi:nucleoside-diphosphate-sugar epimerase
MRALVLGGSVFVGKRLVRALLAQDAEVAVLNRGKTPTALPEGVEHLVADRTDTAVMRAALGDRTWDAVFDVSGFVMAAGDSNIAELLELFDGRVGDYVYVSSIMAYDQSLAGVFPWTEDLPSNPDGAGTYGGFKAVAEQAMLDRHASTGFPVSVVRPAAIYGPDNNIFDMETPMFLRLLQHRPILLPHGGLVATSYGHVDDLCELMVAMVGQPAARGEVFNVNAEGLTSLRYVQELAAIVGADPDVVFVPDDVLPSLTRPVFGHLFGVRHHAIASIEKATSLLGFRPRYDFVDGHVDTYTWFREQGWGDLSAALSDPVWGASWDFEAEAEVAATLR